MIITACLEKEDSRSLKFLGISTPPEAGKFRPREARGRRQKTEFRIESFKQVGPEFLDFTRNPEFIEGLTAEGLKPQSKVYFQLTTVSFDCEA